MSTTPDPTAHNQATYDRIAPLYLNRQLEYEAGGAGGAGPFQILEQKWMAALPAQGRICDVGCGPAFDGGRFRAAGFEVMGIDFSRGMLLSAMPRLPGLLVQADLRALPLRPGSLDGVWCAAALLHVPSDVTAPVLEGVRRALRRGGVLALVTALGEGSRFEPVPYAQEESRWFVYRRRSRLEEQIESAGFRITMSHEIESHRLWLTTLAHAT